MGLYQFSKWTQWIMPITFKDNSLKKLIDKLTFTDKEIKELSTAILKALGKRLEELIQERAPFDTGVYAGDWKVNDVDGNSISVTNPDGKLFTILEFTGRRKGRIHGKPFLHFTINGVDIIVAFVDHPGTQPDPHVTPALEQLGLEGKEIIVKIFKDKFPAFK